MKINTAKFGLLEIDENKVLHFVSEILGFPGSRRYVLLPVHHEKPFLWLQSVDEPQVVFLTTWPRVFFPDYRPEIPSLYLKLLSVERIEDLDLLVILAPGKKEGYTANLMGPIVINVPKRLALQAVLDPERYSPAEPLHLVEKVSLKNLPQKTGMDLISAAFCR